MGSLEKRKKPLSIHRSNSVINPARLRDGTAVSEFLRCNPHWGGVSYLRYGGRHRRGRSRRPFSTGLFNGTAAVCFIPISENVGDTMARMYSVPRLSTAFDDSQNDSRAAMC